jgi:hypothetical protein
LNCSAANQIFVGSGSPWCLDKARGKEIAMKRIVVGVTWFVILYFGILGAGGAILGSLAGSTQKNTHKGYQAGYTAGEEFGKNYGTFVLFAALGGAALGTMTGTLPGTKAKRK